MSRTIWVISDTHFSHKNILTFKDDSGNFIRPGFENVEEMDECICDNWNDTVESNDIIYHLGDVFFSDGIKNLTKLSGRKRLVLGNHDNPKDLKKFMTHFQKIMSCRDIKISGKRVIMSHIPVILDKSRWDLNVHGHIHEKPTMSSKHINVSCEAVNYKPVNLEDLVSNQGS